MRKLYLLLLATVITVVANAQIAVTVTNPGNTTPNLSASYTSLSNALTALNSVTAMSGPVTLTLATGSETAPVTGLTIGSATLNAVLSATNKVTIVKGAGQTPVLNAGVGTAAGPTTATPDGILKIVGADYITIDGLTLTDGNSASPTVAMEFGIGLFKLSATDGATNNTIQNCIINMQRINNTAGTAPMLDGSVGILVINATPTAATTSLTPTAASGTNSNNKFYSNTIDGGNIGIGLSGYAASTGVGPAPTASTFLGDLNNDIGGTGAAAATTGNTVTNFGGAASAANAAAGIRAKNQWGLNISNNIVNNNTGTGVNHVTTLRGIYGEAGTSAALTISYNTVTIKGGATTSSIYAIDNSIGSTASSNTVNITNNTIQNCTYATGTTGTLYCINNSSSAATVNINSNNIQNNTFTGAVTSGIFYAISQAAANTNANSNSNQITGNVLGISGSANSPTFYGIYSSSSPTNFTANTNTISNNSITSSYGSIYCIRGTTSTITLNGNIITNITIPNNASTLSSLIYGYYDGSSPVTETFTNNTIDNLSMTGSNTSTGNVICGFYNNTATGTKTFSGNVISNLNFTSSSTGGYALVIGIRNAYATTSNIFSNKIYSLSSTGTTPTVAGIYAGISSNTTTNIYNNFVGNLTTPQSTGHNLYGIYTGSVGTNINLYFNTVYLNGTSTGSGFASSGIYVSSTTPTVTLNNNIVVNTSTATGAGITAALRRTSTSLTAYGSTSNNNLYYAGTPSSSNLIYYDGTNSDQTLFAFKTRVAFRETNSVTENPPFLSTTGANAGFLHINTAVATQVESGGAPVSGITTDFDGDTRNTSFPDIGADEGTFTIIDNNPPTITYTALTNTCTYGSKTFTAVIADPSGVPTTGGLVPRVWYKKGVNGVWVSNAGSLSSGTTNNGTWSFTIDQTLVSGINGGDTIYYYVIAQDQNSTPNIGSGPSGVTASNVNTVSVHPASPLNYVNGASLSGNYTVGVGGNYTTLTAAAAAYNSGCLTSAVTFTLTDALYGTSETFPVTFNNNVTASAINTLTIKPGSGVAAKINGAAASTSLIKFLNARFITVDGLNTGGSSLTVANNNTASSANIWIASTTGNGNNSISIKNSTLTGTNNNLVAYWAILVGIDGSSPAATNGPDNDNITVQGNTFLQTGYAVWASGTVAATSAGGLDNLIISQNIIGPVAYGVNNIGVNGMFIGNAVNVTVANNTIQNVGLITNTSWSPAGVYLSGGIDGITISQNTIKNITSSYATGGTSSINAIQLNSGVKNATVSRNIITGISNQSTSTTGYAARGIIINTQSATSNINVINNSISDISGYSSSTNPVIGIDIEGTNTGGINIYYNSVYLSGSHVGTTGASVSAPLYIGVSSATALNIKNNVFANSYDNTSSTTDKVYAIYSVTTTNAVFTSINYNDYYVSGTVANVGSLNAVDKVDLTAWKAATAQDANSISSNPLFNNAANLAPKTGSPLIGAGTTIAGTTIDINGVTRNASPAIGAYEVAGDFAAPAITYTALGTTCSTGDIALNGVVITDDTGVPTTGSLVPRIYYRKNSGAWFSQPGSLVTGNATSGTWNFSIVASDMGGVAVNDVISYYVLAQDIVATPNIGSSPSGTVATDVNTVTTHTSGANTYLIALAMSGTYTVGTAGNYTSLTSAVTAYNNACLTGPVTLSLTNATYTTGETFPIVINANSFASATNTLTIKPASGNAATITGSSTSSLIKLNGASYIIVDGSNSGTSTRELTLANTNTSTSTAVVWVTNNGTVGTTNSIIKNSVITNGSNSANANYAISIGGSIGSSGADNDNITIQNNDISNAYIGIYANGSTTTSTGGLDGLTITDNQIGSNVTASQIGFKGMSIGNSLGANITRNKVYNIIGSVNTPIGIELLGGVSNSTLNRNEVANIQYTSTGGYGARGIFVTGNTAANITLSNNLVYGVTGDGDATIPTYTIMGIGIGSGSTYNLYHNSVSLFNDRQTTTWGVATSTDLYIGTGVTGLNVRNNAFYNIQTSSHTGTEGNNYAIYSDATAPFTTINYNDYYVTSATAAVGKYIGYLGSARATLANWKTATAQDANSISADPLFNSNTILAPATGSPLVGAGTPIGSVTTDFRGITRSATAPTIGAYETAGDATPPVISVSAVAYACSTGNQSVSAIITDQTGVPTTGASVPRIYYKKNAGGAWFSQPGTLASGTGTNGTWNFTIVAADMGGLLTTDVVYYYVVAQDIVSTPNIGSSPAGASSVTNDVNAITVHPSSPLQMVLTGTNLSGNYNVGGGGAYATLTAAVAAYNTGCMTGAVTFTLTDATYSGTSETFPIIINANGFASATNTLTIKPALNTAVNMTGTSGATASALIKLNGADYVTIDGIHDAAGTNLTIENTSVTGGTAVIWLASTGVGQGATNNTIKNVTLKAGADQKANTTTTYGIVIAGSSLSSTITSVTAGDDNDNNTIDTCTITKVRYGIYTRGGSTTNPNLGTVIKRNVIGSTGFGVDEIGKAGIVAREEDGIQISNNEIRSVGGDYTNITAGTARAGIALATDATWTPTSVYVKNASINANMIHDIQDERTGAAIGIILAGADGANATNNIVANNFLYNIKANGTSSSNQAVAIGIATGNGDKVVYNSVFMTGSVNASTGSTAPTSSAFGIRVTSTSATNLSILNNIVYMDVSSTPATPKNMCIDIPTGYVWGTGNLNYNDWYANPGNTQSVTGSINNGATQYIGLTAWAAAVNKEANSKELDPQFQSFTDLHLQPSSPLDGQGTVVAGVTKDIDNQTRDLSTPDIGADELPAAAGIDIKPQALVSPAVSLHGCYAVENFVVSIKNNGSSTINFAGTPVTVSVTVSGAPPVPIVKTKTINTGTLAAGAVMNVTMDAAGIDMNLQPGVYIFDMTTTVAGDVNTSNDNLEETRTEESLTYGSTLVTPTDYCKIGGKPVLTATGSNGYSSLQWQQSTTSGSGYVDIPGATGLNFTIPTNITQTMFYKLLAICSSYTDESGESVVVLNNPAPLTTTPATRCGVGTVTLGATADAGATINWYPSLNAANTVGTGTSFTTPVLTHDSTFYVGIVNGGVSGVHVGKTTYGGADGTNTSGAYLIFDALSAFTLNTVTIYPYSATNGTAGTVTIALQNSSGTTLQSATVNVTGNNTAIATPVTVNFAVTPGTAYRLVYASSTGVTALYRDFSGPYAYPYTVANTVSITSSSLGNSYYYYFYDWSISTGCEGTRVPVVAHITAPPALSVTPDKTICNNTVQQLQVTSNVSDFNNYVWTPATALFTDAAATTAYTGTSASQVYVKNNAAGLTKYVLTATNTTTGCVNVDTSRITVMPSPTIASTPSNICVSGTATLGLSPATGYGIGSFQWQSSADGIAPYADISGATSSTYTTPILTQTAYYKVILKDGVGATCATQPVTTLVVNNPQVTSTTPGTRCGPGSVALAATGGTGTTLSWYTTATGGTAVATGATYNTPSISSTTTYYVGASAGGTTASVGKVSTTGADSYNTSGAYLKFDALSDFTLYNVDIYPYSATAGTAGTVTIALQNSAGTTLQQATFNVTGYPNTTPTVYTANVNFNVTAGTQYRLVYLSSTGITGLLRDYSATSGISFPYTLPGVVSITDGSLAGYYYYFYNWSVSTACSSNRLAVVATITSPPTISASATQSSICVGQSTTLNVTSTNANYTYNWSPIAQSGSSVSVTPGSTSTYTVNATDAGTGCTNTGTVTVTVNPLPTAISVTPGSVTLCPNSQPAQLTASGGTLPSAVTVGTGTVQNATATTTNMPPYGNYYTGTRHQMLILASELTAAGLTAGRSLTSVAFDVVSNTNALGYNGFTIKVGHTSASALTTTFLTTPMTTVYANLGNFSPTVGWSTHQFSTPFVWDGVSNVVVETYFSNCPSGGCSGTTCSNTGSGISYTQNAVTNQSNTSFVSHAWYYSDGVGCSPETQATASLTASVRPNMYFTFDNPTSITWAANTGLFTDAAGTTPYTGTAASTVYANPASNTTYTVTATSGAGCTSSNTVTITRSSAVTSATTLAGTSGGGQLCSGNLNVAVSNNFFNNCNLVATIVPSGATAISGNVNACVRLDAIVPTAPNGQPYVQRYYEITPAANRTTATSTITLYFTQAEFNTYNAARGTLPALPTGAADASGIANLRVAEFNHGGVGTGFATYPAGSGSAITPSSVTYNATDNGGTGMWRVTFNATGSGAFYVYTGNYLLPVTITNFRGELAGSVNKLYWNTSTETNNKGFELERSSDGVTFTKITFVATKANGGNSTSALSYNFDDVRPMQGANYYRLKQIDNDGKYSYSNVVLLTRKVTEITLSGVYPNPTTKELNVKIISPRAEKLTIVVTDLTGKVVMQQPMSVVVGDNQQQMNVSPLAAGTYIVKAICANGCETAVHRFVKQ